MSDPTATPTPRAGAVSGLPYPSPTDPIADGADDIRRLAEATAARRVMTMNGISFGTAAPSGGQDGDIYFQLV